MHSLYRGPRLNGPQYSAIMAYWQLFSFESNLFGYTAIPALTMTV